MTSRIYWRFLIIAAVPISLLSVLVVCLGAWLEPLDGDLTRLGGYPENDFGWRGTQVGFSPELAPFGVLGDSYDVVVIGDSFSIPPGVRSGEPRADRGYWTDFFVQLTGLNVGTFHREMLGPEDLLRSDAWRTAPPRLLVLEYAERNLGLVPLAAVPCEGRPDRGGPDLPRRPVPAVARTYVRDTGHRIGTTAIDASIDFLIKAVPRWVAGVNTTQVLHYDLTRSDLFSNRRAGELLVYANELRRARTPVAELERIGCTLLNLQEQVEANGWTRFVLMVAPDRSVVYSAWLPGLHLPNMTDILARTPGLQLLRLDHEMSAATAEGVQDVYAPNDTYWASVGKQIAAEALASFVAQGHASIGPHMQGHHPW